MNNLLSVIIPAYNEESCILPAVDEIGTVLTEAAIPYELIFIDDGSKDRTYEKMIEAYEKDNRVRGCKFSRNFGKEMAIFAGLKMAEGGCCVVIDCDLQHPPACIIQMYCLWQKGFHIVEGVKSSRGKESLIYKGFSHIFYKILSWFVKFDLSRSSDFKLLDRSAVNIIVQLQEKNMFFRALSYWIGFKTIEVQYDVAPRTQGQSKWSFLKLVKYAINNITSFTAVPLQMVTIAGLLFLVLAVVLGIQALIMYFCGKAAEGFTTVILLLLMIGGTIMVSLGIIGHYIARIYEEVKNRPRYIVENCFPQNSNSMGVNQ